MEPIIKLQRLNYHKIMSSCQDSMDTEDSIPRPEYEDIVPDEDEDDEDDDNEFWVEKSKLKSQTPLENGSGQEASSTTQTNISADTPTPSSISPTQNFDDANVDEAMEGSYDGEEEISYDEADENFEREEPDEDSRKSCEKIEENQQTPQAEQSDDASVNVVTVATEQTTSETQTDSANNKLLLVTVVKDNGKLILPIQRAEQQLIAITKDKEPSSADENNSTHLAVRSLTPPSGRASREFIALQRSFTESKVLSEFVSEKDRQRKSRKVPLKSHDSVVDFSEREKYKVCRGRSKSCTRTPSRQVAVLNSSAPQKWPSEEKLNCKRENMRSQNTDFVQKQMKFLNRVKHDATADDVSELSESEQSLNESNKTVGSVETKDDCWQPPPKKGADSFCWKCRKCADLIACSKCPRSFHYRCIKVGTTTRLDRTWICPECINLEGCINGTKKTKKEALSIDMLNQLLLYALKRMKQIKGHEKLLNPPDENECPLYSRYVVNPVTLNSIQDKIEKKAFRCTEEFVLETKWIQHNVSIAYAAYGTKDGLLAKTLLKVCRQEAAEIETCPECYLNANTHKDWFVDVCLKPHILLWAKLKGFPYWPAKGMGLGPNSLVNVRFFGDHDRAFVPVKDCFLYSEVDPNPNSGKRTFRPGIADCIKEVDIHIEKIKAKVGAFCFAPPKTPYDPSKELSQLEEMMPGVTEYVKKQQALQKPPLTYKIVKTAGNNLSIIKKPDSGTESDHSMGAEKIKNNVSATKEVPKPSPLSEEDVKPMEEQNSSSPKHSSSSKIVLSKAVSLNYEVVAKPPSKDEANSSKINSVILKRKSDVVVAPPNVKKSKSSEDIPAKECVNITPTSTSTSPTHQVPVEVAPLPPAKRIRRNDSGEKGSLSPGTRINVTFRIEQPPQKTVIVQKPPKVQTLSQSVIKEPSAESAANEPSLAVAKLVQNRQGVTIKKLTKKHSSVNMYICSEENGPAPTMQQTVNMYVEQLKKPMKAIQMPKSIPLTSMPSKHVKIVAKSQQPLAKSPSSAVSVSKSKARTPSAPAAIPKVVQTSPEPSDLEKPPDQGNIPIPCVEIKLEKPDEDEQSCPKANALVSNPLKVISVSGARPSPVQSSFSKVGIINPRPIIINPELVKTEIVSDDDSQESTPSQENSAALSQSTGRSTEEPRVADSATQRIVVRSIESLTMQPPQLKNSQSLYTAPTTSPTTPTTTSAQPKKSNARARKSFPNKGPSVSAIHLPPDINRSLTKNSMVYIPVDSQNNSVPIQPLTAVSKPISQASSAAKTSCTTTVAVSLPLTNSFFDSTSQTSTTPPTSSTLASTASTQPSSLPANPTPPPAAPPPPPGMQTDQSALSDSLPIMNSQNSSVPMDTAIARPSYVASLKTLSPLQLTDSSATNTAPTEADVMGDKNSQEGDGHILSGIVTPNLASAITDTIVRGPPRLTPRPNGALRSDGSHQFNSEAGPFSRALVENAHKMTDFFISVMQDTVGDMANADILPAKIVQLQLELEAKTASYEKRLFELKQNTDTMLCEMKKNMEIERIRIIAETRKQCEIERILAVEQAKKKQWCSNCGREANSYCCWNTAYCDTNCQGMDWLRHKPNCCQVNPHLNTELQGPGVLYPAPATTSAASSVTTTSTIPVVTTSNLVPIQSTGGATIHIYSQPTQPALVPISTSAPIPISQISVTTSVASKLGPNPTYPQTPVLPLPSTDPTFKTKEVLKLPPSTYLRAVPPTMRLPTPPVHRFNIPLPIAAASSTGGPPYTLIHREGNWELMGTPQQPVTSVIPTTTSFPQTPRLISPAAAPNLPQDNRTLGQVLVRPNQM